jgi:hypothetical protein
MTEKKRKYGGRGNAVPDEIVRAIRQSDEPARVLAERYGLHRVTIHKIRNA